MKGWIFAIICGAKKTDAKTEDAEIAGKSEITEIT